MVGNGAEALQPVLHLVPVRLETDPVGLDEVFAVETFIRERGGTEL